MNITLDDGRTELWQWDTGRKIVVDDKSVSEVHYSKYSSTQAITREVIGGKAEIPNFLLQDTHAVTVYAYSGSIENGYTVAEKTFNVAKKPKPANYVETEEDKAILAKLKAAIGDLSELQTEAKNNLVSAINEAAASGGIDMGITGATVGQIANITAVDDTGKPTAWSPADMPSGGSNDFVIIATVASGNTCTMDKTYAQIQEAIQDGKRAVMKANLSGADLILPQVGKILGYYIFSAVFSLESGTAMQYTIMVGERVNGFNNFKVVTYDTDGNLQQVTMDSDPTEAMEIATKQYVDASGVPPVTSADNGKFLRVANGAWEAADMPSGGASEFVVNGTIGGETGVGYSITLDKTADQILAAINEGKSVIARVAYEITIDLPLVSFDTISGNIIFAGIVHYAAMDSISPIIYFLRLRSDEATLYSSTPIGLDPEGNLPQVSMASAPTSDMQIATKKYVDDKEFILQSTTPNSTKKFKITVDDTGALSAVEVTTS